MQAASYKQGIYLEYDPLPVTVTTRIITSLVGDPYKPLLGCQSGYYLKKKRRTIVGTLNHTRRFHVFFLAANL